MAKKRRNEGKLGELALSVAGGTTITAACNAIGVRPRTGYEWSKSSEFKTLVAEHRNQAISTAIGRLSKYLVNAANKLIILMDKGKTTDSVQLAAAKAMFEKLNETTTQNQLLTEMAELRREHHELEAMFHAIDPQGD